MQTLNAKHFDLTQWFDTLLTFVFFWPVTLALRLGAFERVDSKDDRPATPGMDHPSVTSRYDGMFDSPFGFHQRFSQGYFRRYRW